MHHIEEKQSTLQARQQRTQRAQRAVLVAETSILIPIHLATFNKSYI